MKREEINIIVKSYGYVKSYIKKILLILLLVVANVAAGIIQPILWGYLLEAILKLDIAKFTTLILWVLVIFIFEAVILYAQSYLSTNVNESIKCEMKGKVFSKVMNYQMRLLDKMGIGDVLSHLEGDVEVIVDVYTNQILNVIIAILKALIIGTIAIAISWPMAALIILMLPVNYIIVDKFGRALQSSQMTLRENMDRYYSNTQEYIGGIKSIKSQGAKEFVYKKFESLICKNKLVGIRIGKLVAGSSGLSSLINFITQIMVYLVGMYLLVRGEITFAIFVAFSAYTASLSGALLDITQINPRLQQAVVSIKRVNKILDEFEDNQEHLGNRNVENINGDVLVDNVSFGYDHILFDSLNIKFSANKKYAVVGHSGSGKSSLFNLLLKIYDVDKGRILIDGIDINELSEECFRSIIGIVQQEPILFNMSIMDNIKMEQQDASDEQIYNAAKMANIDDEIRKMQEGYNTVINGISDNLSVGQKQRIALARILLKNPKIMLFDEVTSALDNISQQLVNDAVNRLKSTHTIIVISHNISSIMDSDEIFVMDHGKIVGHGRHENLLKNCTSYKKLYEKENDNCDLVFI